MGKIISLRGAQYPLVMHRALSFNDWCVDAIAGTKKTLGSTVANSTAPSEASLTNGKNGLVTIPLFNMPNGAIIIGGSVVVETAWAGPTAVVDIGTVAAEGAIDKLIQNFDAAATAVAEFIVSTNVRLTSQAGYNLYAGLTLSNVDSTAGKIHVFVKYIIEGKTNEVVPN